MELNPFNSDFWKTSKSHFFFLNFWQRSISILILFFFFFWLKYLKNVFFLKSHFLKSAPKIHPKSHLQLSMFTSYRPETLVPFEDGFYYTTEHFSFSALVSFSCTERIFRVLMKTETSRKIHRWGLELSYESAGSLLVNHYLLWAWLTRKLIRSDPNNAYLKQHLSIWVCAKILHDY